MPNLRVVLRSKNDFWRAKCLRVQELRKHLLLLVITSTVMIP